MAGEVLGKSQRVAGGGKWASSEVVMTKGLAGQPCPRCGGAFDEGEITAVS